MSRWRRAEGQASAEYLGAIVLVGLIVLAVLSTPLPSTIANGIERVICAITGGSCEETNEAAGGDGGEPAGPGPTRHIFDAGNDNELPGEPARDEGDDPTGDAEVDAAYDNFGRIHDYFMDRFGRNSYDDMGGPLTATVRYRRDPDMAFPNAYWDPERRQMVFGEGYAQPLDVTAHEVTHALTESTAGLEYQGESGALNESISDIFASNLDPDDWELGEDLPDGAIRDLSDPERFDQPAHVDDYQDLPPDVDNGGVHINSGIPNHAYYNMVQLIGRDASEQIVYRAVSEHLDSDSGFEDFRTACLTAARDLYGEDSAEYEGVEEAFARVGLDGTWEPPGD
jgi:Zn-dependent metalloprotease